MPTSAPITRAAAGPPLSQAGRRRPIGRIGGRSGAGPDLQADYDVCWLDGSPLRSLDDWRALLTRGRLADVEGAFALAWQTPDGTLTLARDGVGERTLFYAPLAGCLVFASTIRELLATGLVPRRLHLPAVAAYLSYAYLPGRETLVDGVFELLPGEVLEYRGGQLTRRSFWTLPAEETETRGEDELRGGLSRCLEVAVQRGLPSGQPVGAFLSGGLDSSLIVALACRLHDAPVKSYSISFGEGYANELPFSSLVSEHCRTDHRIVELSPAAILHHLDETIAQLSDPIGDPLTVPNALLFREAAAEVGVVLNGEGGDPCFGGPKNLPMLLAELYDSGEWTRERSYLRAHMKCYDDLEQMLTSPMRDALAAEPLEAKLAPWLRDQRWPRFVSRLQAVNVAFKGAHHILPKVDALGFAAGVLPRSPLFARHVVEWSFAIPPQLKLKGSSEKYLLKEAVRDLLPAEIVDRPKSGMMVPVEAWFQGPLLPAARERLLDGLTKWNIVERAYVDKLLDGKLGGLRPRRGAKLWLLLTLESWLRTALG